MKQCACAQNEAASPEEPRKELSRKRTECTASRISTKVTAATAFPS